MKKIAIGTLIYVFVSFIIQTVSHFGLSAQYYDAIGFIRKEPIIWMWIVAMVLQGVALTSLYKGLSVNGSDWKTGLVFGITIAMLMVGYTALVEPSKYEVANIGSWMLVETSVGIVQFLVFGVLIGMLFKNNPSSI